jgi:subtilisin family serine protease
MRSIRKSQRKLVRNSPRAAKVRPCVEQLESRDLPSIVSIMGQVVAAPAHSITLNGSLGGVTPNNPSFGSQWDLQNTGQSGGTPGADIHATQAWAVTTGSAATVVAVIDTGVDYNHPDLYQNIWINQAEIPKSRLMNLVDVNGDGYISFADLNNPINQGVGKITDVNGDGRIDAADILAPMVLDSFGNDTGLGGWAHHSTQDGDTAHPDDLIGWNFVNNTNNPFDDNGHGTHVSGTIGAMGNSGVGVTGINWSVSIMALKFLDANGSGYDSGAVNALNYAVAHGASISNNSWGGASYDPSLLAAIQNAQAHGDIFVAAAGNNGQNLAVSPTYPASYNLDNMVVVAATDRNDQLASFSNYGAGSVALAAPGVEILSTTPNNTYSWYSGTSMAAPHVTGVLALLKSQHPSWSYGQLINQILSTADPLPGLQGKTKTGGRLDAAAALGTATATPTAGDANFIQHLYSDVLGRTGDASEINSWISALNAGISRAQIARSFWESTEHRFREVDSYYARYLHRSADPAGESGFEQAMLNGVSESDVILGFVTSAEYAAGHPNAASFVDGLYQDLLGRAVDPAGRAGCVALLAATGRRDLVADSILHSSEFYGRTVDGYYTQYLLRSGGPSEELGWVTELEQGRVSIETAGIGFLASDEYGRRP